MKSSFLIGSLIVGALCTFSSADAQEAEANKIHSELKTLYQEIGKDLGFVGEDELRGSTLGSPIQVYMSGLDDLEKYKDGEDPHSLLRNTNEVIFPIYSGGRFKSSITLVQEERDGKWELASFGGSEAKLSESSRSKHSDASRKAKTDYMAVHIPSMQQLFVGYDDKGKLFLIPCHKNDLINLEADVAIPAEAAIAAMKPHVAKFRNVLAPSTANTLGLTNSGFEDPRGTVGSYTLVKDMPGWKTTDKEFEIWSTGFLGVTAHEGTQFVELNAWIDGTLYQDSTGIKRGSPLDFTFAHRGRNGDDAMKLTITDLGADNALDGGDDTVLFTKQYTTGKDAWVVYNSTTEQKIKALGNTIRFAYGAISATGGNLGQGNLLDAANFGVGVVSEVPPENAMKLDVDGGAFTFGYRTTAMPGFNEFPNTDSPHPGIMRRNIKDGDYFSFAQNTRDTELKAQETSLVHYPAKSEGSGVLCPGINPGDIAIARFTAMADGEYKFKISAELIEEKPTGAGVTIYVNGQAVAEKQLTEHLVPWSTSFQQKLTKGQTVDIAVDSGVDKNWEKDHVLITAKAWTTRP